MIPATPGCGIRSWSNRLADMEEVANEFPFQRRARRGDAVVVTAGVAYQYVKEAFPGVNILKLAMTNPMPRGLISGFCEQFADVYVVENSSPTWRRPWQGSVCTRKGRSASPGSGS